MKWIEKQEGLQERVEDYIDELADELDLEAPYYPQAYYFSGKSKARDFWLCKKHNEMFEHMKESGGSSCWADPYVVWLRKGQEGDLEEECSHALNFAVSGIRYYEGPIDLFFGKVMSEFCGFLGSKLLNPSRKNCFLEEQDIYQLPPEKILEFINENFSIALHQQGYCLAERVYFEYLSGNFEKKELRKIFTTDFSKKGSAMKTFDNLRKKYWPIP